MADIEIPYTNNRSISQQYLHIQVSITYKSLQSVETSSFNPLELYLDIRGWIKKF